jgi:hypothetical protein
MSSFPPHVLGIYQKKLILLSHLHFNPSPQRGIDRDQIVHPIAKFPGKPPKFARDQCLQVQHGRKGLMTSQEPLAALGGRCGAR